jgi:hypothetical protein
MLEKIVYKARKDGYCNACVEMLSNNFEVKDIVGLQTSASIASSTIHLQNT